MKVSKKTYASFMVFIFSGMIFMILLSTTTGLNQLNIYQELKNEELQWGKNILEQCKLSHEKYAQIKEILFNAEQELLNDNRNNAAKYFNQVRPELGTCAFELSGKPHPIDTFLGRASGLITLFSGGITLTSFLLDNFRKKRQDN